MSVAPFGEALPVAVARAQGHDPADGLHLVPDGLDERNVLLADEQHLGFGIVDDLQHFGRGQSPVYRHHHGAGLGDAKQQLEEQVAALVEMGDADLRREAFGDQAAGDAAGGAIEPAIARGPALIDDRHRVRARRAVDAHDVGQADHLDAHRTLPLQHWPVRAAAGGVILRRF